MNHISAGKYLSLKKMANEQGQFFIFGIEYQHNIGKAIQDILQLNDLPDQAIRNLKDLVLRIVSPECTGIVVDPVYSLASAMMLISNRIGIGMTLDSGNYDREDSKQTNMITELTPNWNVNKTKRLGMNCAKISVNYDSKFDAIVLQRQRDLVRDIGRQCTNFDIALVVHLKVGTDALRSAFSEADDKLADYLRAIDIFAHSDYGADLLVVDLPYITSSLPDPRTGHHKQVTKMRETFAAIDNALSQAWVITNSDANSSTQDYKNLLGYAVEAGASGFLMGDALWHNDFSHFPNIPRMEDSLRANTVRLMQDFKDIFGSQVNPWYERSHYTSADEKARPHQVESRYFPSLYPSVKIDV